MTDTQTDLPEAAPEPEPAPQRAASLLARIIDHLRNQHWTAVFLEFVVVVAGVFIGFQLNNWNEERELNQRRDQIIAALVTDLRDATRVQTTIVEAVEAGRAQWQSDFEAGDLPPPYYLRFPGSDTAPQTWDALQRMQLPDMLDPTTIFDLAFYYSELEGVGQKYTRYVTFVESHILPNLKRDPSVFYLPDKSALLPEFEANMDRASDYAADAATLNAWASCLVYRLEAGRSFDQTCRRAGFRLEGMTSDELARLRELDHALAALAQ
ncbi:MAG: hypothetical protein R3C46_16765 [Hyphomonadaceae bacterium]